MTKLSKKLKRKIRHGEIVMTKNGEWHWSIKLLGYNIRCRVCKEVKHKDDFIGRGFRACSDCRTNWVRGVAHTPGARISRAKIEVKNYYKGRRRMNKKRDLGNDLRKLIEENNRTSLL